MGGWGLTELIVDNFAGGGGASLGIEMAAWRSPDIAINHDPEAIAMHAANHPHTKHYCESVWDVDPRDVCGGRPVGLGWFSPDCKHFSKAKGGRPVDKDIRGLAWVVIKWAHQVRPRIIALENVEEFQTWGPLVDGKPCPARKAAFFHRWVGMLEGFGYRVEWRELRACDYGAPTIRNRLYLIARRDGQPIVWPTPTHGPGLKPYATAAQCIDWSVPVHSIFMTPEDVKARGLRIRRPLAENTLKRIARGVFKYVVDAADPFIVTCNHGGDWFRGHGVDRPFNTMTAARDAHGLVMPHFTHVQHSSAKFGAMPADEPMRTVTAQPKGGGIALTAPYFVPRYGERDGQYPRARSVEQPFQTIVPSGNAASLVSAFLAQHNTGVTGHDFRKPMSTITGRGTQQNVVTAHLTRQFGRSVGSGCGEPIGTVTAGGGGKSALVTSHLAHLRGSNVGGGGDPLQPMKAVTAGGNHIAEVRAFLTKYFGKSFGQALGEPAHTLSTKDRFGLVTVAGHDYQIADIGMRMLIARELYRAQGFPDSYVIAPVVDGKPLSITAQVRMCGNSVCPDVARAILEANFVNQAVRGAA